MSEADEIARAVLDEFRKLPAKRKPCVRDNGLHEWIPLSGIVAKSSVPKPNQPQPLNLSPTNTQLQALPSHAA